ncbi:glycine cleavage system aminomethyltransferase GcvT [Alicyclobacillus tolerans]|uniref:glycine cleavage system aminomethyltransferase GcvT n=1 Tax=Alicyclobacillus tolerans TaxID=90970 RepID=UPI001EFF6870|nr:glycine cleavage system aminomethyltransferase GcvT [Alicyclobacillus tolerans]MCF8563577.1 glycine cleavage system aminomethyltransferase GcvT [Alicyclobacillus tolerans]
MGDLKKTPLYPLYEEYGAKTVEFGGWDMPVQFSGIIAEHEAVRNAAGLFDVSHMGEFEVTGPDATRFLQSMVTNDVSRLESGMAMYSPMTNESGGCVDDLLVYCFHSEKYWVVVNAGNIDKDFNWMRQHLTGFRANLVNRSEEISLLALQGPMAESILEPITDQDLKNLRYYRFFEGSVAGMPMVISRTGYTGEDGFELYAPAADAAKLWVALLEQGKGQGLIPCGLGARDTLRLEARLPLYGHELTETITPLEAGLSMFVKFDKGEFIGRSALQAQKESGIPRKIVGVQVQGRGIVRQGYEVTSQGRGVGRVTSGTMSPTLKLPIGLVLVDANEAAVGTQLEVVVRNKPVSVEVVKTPFYKRQK